eukprot:2586915-Pleurochrysis_carterae.AAC.2
MRSTGWLKSEKRSHPLKSEKSSNDLHAGGAPALALCMSDARRARSESWRTALWIGVQTSSRTRRPVASF